MSLLTENVIPSDYGRIFSTNAKSDLAMEKIKTAIEKVDGIRDVILIMEVYPRELIVRTNKLITVDRIEDAVKQIGLHCIPKGVFPTLEK